MRNISIPNIEKYPTILWFAARFFLRLRYITIQMKKTPTTMPSKGTKRKRSNSIPDPKQSKLISDRQGILRLSTAKKPVPLTRIFPRKTRAVQPTPPLVIIQRDFIPTELVLLIAQADALAAIKMHAVNRSFREVVKKNLFMLTKTVFLPGIEDIYLFSRDWGFKGLLHGLYDYFGNHFQIFKDLNGDVRALKHYIKTNVKRESSVKGSVSSWLHNLPETKLSTADARAYMTTVLRRVRGHFGSEYLKLGNADGTRGAALQFIARAERIVVSEFRASYGESMSLEVHWYTNFMWS